MNKNIKRVGNRVLNETVRNIFVPNLLCFSIFISPAPPGTVAEAKIGMQRHRTYMTSFVTSKVQTTVSLSFVYAIYNDNDKFNNFNKNSGKMTMLIVV